MKIERMNWWDRVRLLGAPGPRMADLPRSPINECSPAGPIIRSRPAGAIIVGIEGSKRSADALALADLLAGLIGGPPVLVHNHPYGAPSKVPKPQEGGHLGRSASYAAFARVQKLARRYPEAGIRVTHAASPAKGLQECVASENAQLIVVGPSHRSGLGQVLPGSVGERLLSGARVPVAIAPRGYADAVPSLGVVASAFDGSPESRLALDWAADLARSSCNQLRVISVHAPTAYAGLGSPAVSVDPAIRRGLQEAQAAAIAAYDGPVEAIVPDGDPARTLVKASKEAGILIMGSRGYGPLRAALLGGVSHYVIRHAACPVVVLPRGADRADIPRPDQEPAVRDAAA